MKGKRMNEADKRVPVRADNLQELKDYAYGLGGTYDDAIRVLLSIAKREGESALDAGKRAKEEHRETDNEKA